MKEGRSLYLKILCGSKYPASIDAFGDMKIQALLLVAVDCNRPSCIKVLIDDGAGPDGAANIMTPLTIAASRGYLACMQTLCLRLLLSSGDTDSPVLRADCLEAARIGRHPQCV
jgi:hypothetical protein